MSRIALGTVQFGMKYGISNQHGIVQSKQINSIINIADILGIDTLDTAINYQDSEKNLGRNKISKFKIITKVPALPNHVQNVHEWYSTQVNLSIERLNVKKIYGLLLHRAEDLLGDNGTLIFNALIELKKTGLVDKIGISINSFYVANEIIKKYKLDLIQLPFNIIDHRLIKSGMLQRIKDKDYEIHTRSAFLQGLLLMDEAERPAKFLKWDSIWKELSNWKSKNSINVLQAAIQFPLSFPEIDKVIVGVQNSDQLIEIFNLANNKLIEKFPNIQCDDEDLINPSRWDSIKDHI